MCCSPVLYLSRSSQCYNTWIILVNTTQGLEKKVLKYKSVKFDIRASRRYTLLTMVSVSSVYLYFFVHLVFLAHQVILKSPIFISCVFGCMILSYLVVCCFKGNCCIIWYIGDHNSYILIMNCGFKYLKVFFCHLIFLLEYHIVWYHHYSSFLIVSICLVYLCVLRLVFLNHLFFKCLL